MGDGGQAAPGYSFWGLSVAIHHSPFWNHSGFQSPAWQVQSLLPGTGLCPAPSTGPSGSLRHNDHHQGHPCFLRLFIGDVEAYTGLLGGGSIHSLCGGL